MNGVDHYREAERLLRAAEKATQTIRDNLDTNTSVRALQLMSDAAQQAATAAQAHATLALVAAQVDAEKDSAFVAAVSR